jgi:hypothetical protein
MAMNNSVTTSIIIYEPAHVRLEVYRSHIDEQGLVTAISIGDGAKLLAFEYPGHGWGVTPEAIAELLERLAAEIRLEADSLREPVEIA